MTVEDIARVCHAANLEYCRAIDDQPQKAWEETSEHVRHSAVDGIRFVLENPGIGIGDLHANWLSFKYSDGWTYGPVRDAKAKTHPCVLPFAELPREQQAKDHLFLAIVRALAPFITA